MTDSSPSIRSRQRQILVGLSVVLVAVILLSAMVSYYFSWENDQSAIVDFTDRSVQTENIASKFGTTIAHFLMYQFLGLGSFVLVMMLLITGFRLFIGNPWKQSLRDLVMDHRQFDMGFSFNELYPAAIPYFGGNGRL